MYRLHNMYMYMYTSVHVFVTLILVWHGIEYIQQLDPIVVVLVVIPVVTHLLLNWTDHIELIDYTLIEGLRFELQKMWVQVTLIQSLSTKN